MKVRRLKSDCCGMKVGEVYEVVEGDIDGPEHYVSVRLPDGTVTSDHWAPGYFEEVNEDLSVA